MLEMILQLLKFVGEGRVIWRGRRAGQKDGIFPHQRLSPTKTDFPRSFHRYYSSFSQPLIICSHSFFLSGLSAGMIPRAILARRGHYALQCHARKDASRCLATAASGSFSYETGDVAGLKVASRDLPGPTTHLAVVAKAGTRYQPLPGFSEGLEKFSFKVRPPRPWRPNTSSMA